MELLKVVDKGPKAIPRVVSLREDAAVRERAMRVLPELRAMFRVNSLLEDAAVRERAMRALPELKAMVRLIAQPVIVEMCMVVKQDMVGHRVIPSGATREEQEQVFIPVIPDAMRPMFVDFMGMVANGPAGAVGVIMTATDIGADMYMRDLRSDMTHGGEYTPLKLSLLEYLFSMPRRVYT